MLSGGQFGQLSMFATAREVHDNWGHIDLNSDARDTDTLYEDKQAEGIGGDVQREGVRVPILAVHRGPDVDDYLTVEAARQHAERSGAPLLWDGHHRTAHQYLVDPDRLMPVLHDDVAAEGYRHQAGIHMHVLYRGQC